MSLLMANRALIKTVGSSPFPPVIEDGNSVGWYIGDDLSTITKDASDFMSEWRDYLGSGHNLLQALGSNQPKWFLNDGVLLDGIDNFMKTLAFTFNQPEQIYIVFKQITWTGNRYIFDGRGNAVGVLNQYTPTLVLAISAGAALAGVSLPLNTFGIVRVLFNSTASELILNEDTPVVGNAGIKNMGGFTLGSHYGQFNFSNIQVKEILLRKIADNATDEQAIYDYLANKYSI